MQQLNARVIKLQNGEFQIAVPELAYDDEIASRLDHIPGLRLDRPGAGVYGPVDAVAVACRRLDLPIPKAPVVATPFTKNPTLRAYQQAGIGWLLAQLTRTGAAVLADDMGLGKSVQAITAMRELEVGSILVICPGMVRETWVNEIRKWTGQEAHVIRTGEQAEDESLADHRWVVTSYDLTKKLSKFYMPDGLIVDEIHLAKGRWAGRSRRVEEMAMYANYRLGLSGTPQWDRLRDWWMLLRILFRNRFGTAHDFDFAYCGGVTNDWGGRENKGATRVEEFKQRLQYVMLRREKRDVAKELPALQRNVVWIEGTKEAKIAFDAFLLGRGNLPDARKTTLKAKMEPAIELAAQAKRFLLTTWMKEHARQLFEKLNAQGTPCLLITGDLSDKKRQQVILQAKTSGCGIVATLDSLSTGVDGIQHVADVGIFHSMDYVPTKMAQAEARLHRIGQQSNVTWYYLAMRDSVDTLIISTVVEKLDQWRGVMGQQSLRQMRDALGDHIDGAGVEEGERKLLQAIYEEMEG